ncbi:MAG: PTS sugar transporter subunit IIA [Verrucomicrobia bacterium]|nr:PTS sugar transporter subunit IIA [Verrucomicrobiota bacterium]MBS0636297.1 PTS sugar transporter subunit IIA [Verrucomicrobiota bacterium]
MDLELQEVAGLLNVPENVLLKWVSDGKVPSYNINGHFRFSRQEIETWVMSKDALKEDDLESVKPSNGPLRYNLFRALNNGDVFTDIEADTKQALIRTTMQRLAPSLRLDADVLYELFMDRENLVSTAVGNGIAIPHARDFLMAGHRDAVAVVFLQKPINYGALDGQPVHTLFFLLASDDKRHLALLSKIAHLASTPDMLKQFSKRPQKAELLDIIKTWETKLLDS